MAIEGPLRELGIHDVFQLLDLSRKTGRLRVSSALRDNEGVVHFLGGRIVAASMRSNPYPIGQILVRAGRLSPERLEEARTLQQVPEEQRRIGEILVAMGAVTARELERHVHQQIEAVVFELLSWEEGFFSFAESAGEDLPVETVRGVSAEALLMEGARRIDEWARIADVVPDVDMVPVYAAVDPAHPSRLELLPSEWEILVAVDGVSDIRAVASMLGRSDFDVAKVMYGLVSTGVLALHRAVTPPTVSPTTDDDPVMLLADAREALHDGRSDEALRLAERAAEKSPQHVDALVDVARALLALHRTADAQSALGRALTLDPSCIGALMLSAQLAARAGDLERAMGLWKRAVDADPTGAATEKAREAMAHARRLTTLLEVVHA
ncbi:MAG: DUF4388 domain-containing protein [Gemmatimonadaceae bacterium]